MFNNRVTTAALATVFVTAIASTALAASGPPPFVTGAPTPVIITNPNSTPAPVTVINPPTPSAPDFTVNTNDPGRVPYQSFVSLGPLNGCAGGASKCTFSFGNIPAGSRLVVQHVSASLQFSGTPISVGNFLSSSSNQLVESTVFPAPVLGGGSEFDQPVLFFIDGGAHPVVDVFVRGQGAFSVNGQTMTMTGYLLDCTVNSCAPITH
jgi:hypothetical protein